VKLIALTSEIKPQARDARVRGPLVMRIGEILFDRGWISWESLVLAIGDHRQIGLRLCSYLVARRTISFDQAAVALAEQHGVSALLRRHLERRDRGVVPLLPAALARKHVALPIGRMSDGALIVCTRDPSPTVRSELGRAIAGALVLAVTPARAIEHLVAQAYPHGASAEIEIPIELDDGELTELDVDDVLDGEHDDALADFAIDIEMPAKPAAPVSSSRSLPVEIKPDAAASVSRDPLEVAIAACHDIDELGWLLDVVMAYVAGRWRSSLLFEVRERRAIGIRGHGGRIGPTAIRTFVIDLDDPSLLQRARDQRGPVAAVEPAASEDDESLVAALGCSHPVVQPMLEGEVLAYLLVVGEPIERDPEETESDLGLLSDAMHDALARL